MTFQLGVLYLCFLSVSAFAGGGKVYTVDVDNGAPLYSLAPTDLLVDDPWSADRPDATGTLNLYSWESGRTETGDYVSLITDPDRPVIAQSFGPSSITFRLIPVASLDVDTCQEIRDYWRVQGWRWPTLRELLVIQGSRLMQSKRRLRTDIVSMVVAESTAWLDPADLIAVYRSNRVHSGYVKPQLDFFDGYPDMPFTVSGTTEDLSFVAIIPQK